MVTLKQKKAESVLQIYHENDSFKINYTFADVYRMWSKEGLADVSKSYISATHVAYHSFKFIHDKEFALLRIVDIQVAIDNIGKNYPMLRKLKLLVSQLYRFAIKQGICCIDISEFIDIKKYKERNPYKVRDCIINEEDIKILWKKSKNEYLQMILILMYTGVQINEFINIKKVNVCLSGRYIKIVGPKDNMVLRIVPISHKILPFIKCRMKHSDSPYVFTTDSVNQLDY